jgi:hypothetical protein
MVCSGSASYLFGEIALEQRFVNVFAAGKIYKFCNG